MLLGPIVGTGDVEGQIANSHCSILDLQLSRQPAMITHVESVLESCKIFEEN